MIGMRRLRLGREYSLLSANESSRTGTRAMRLKEIVTLM